MREGNILFFSTHNTNKCIFSIFGKGNKEWCSRISTECPLGLSQVLETLSLVYCSLLFTQWDKAVSCGWLLFLLQWTQIGLTSKKWVRTSLHLLSVPLVPGSASTSKSLTHWREIHLTSSFQTLIYRNKKQPKKCNSNDDYLEEHTVPYWETPDQNASILTFESIAKFL